MGAFLFLDEIAEVRKLESVTGFFTLRGTEEFLKDHFEGFPVMPGVLLLEALKQAASHLLLVSKSANGSMYRFLEARDLKFGKFVKPGDVLRIFARLVKEEGPAHFFEARADLVERTSKGSVLGKALSANFVLVSLLER